MNPALKKWLPLGVIVVVVAVIGIIAVVNSGGNDDEEVSGNTDSSADTSTDSGDSDGIGAPAPTGEMPITYNEAKEDGTEGDYDWGDTCDTETGLVKLPSVYAPPCVPVFDGEATEMGPGVTADTIKVVWYDTSAAGGTDALLGDAGLEDTPEGELETYQQFAEIFSSTMETYGRQFEIIPFTATGAFGDAVASLADAQQIANDIQPFAVMGTALSDGGVFVSELARNEIPCIGCSGGLSECTINENANFIWGLEPSGGQLIQLFNGWIEPGEDNTGLTGNAEFAGDPALASQPRKFGLVHYDQDPPLSTVCPESIDFPEDLIREPYLLDFATMPQKSSEIAARLKSEGVTSVIYMGDPIMPTFLMGAATAIDYRPEWIFTGTVLTDTNTWGRMYDQDQMAHTFGVSQTGAPTTPDVGGTIKFYRWYFGEDATPPAPSGYAVLAAYLLPVARGVHMAGPQLDPETFSKGLFRIPPSGGDPVNPQLSRGNWGFFPETDYNGVDDMAQIWWDAEAEGPDELGKVG
ncbi:MAG: hypothetical protein ACK5O2_13350, partial [Microthrixaceae bacterium]